MKREDKIKIIKNSIDNFLIEFFIQNFLENGKHDNNVISFGILISGLKFEYYFLVKQVTEELKDHVDEMLFEVLAEVGYNYNLKITDVFLIDKSEFKNLLVKENFECIYIRPDCENLLDCTPMFSDEIKYYFDKYVDNLTA